MVETSKSEEKDILILKRKLRVKEPLDWMRKDTCWELRHVSLDRKEDLQLIWKD